MVVTKATPARGWRDGWVGIRTVAATTAQSLQDHVQEVVKELIHYMWSSKQKTTTTE